MGVTNKPQDDAQVMTDEYIKGVTIADLATKYNHSEQEVTDVVTNVAPTKDLPTQTQEDRKEVEAVEAVEPKKGK